MKTYRCDGGFNSKYGGLKFSIILFSFKDETGLQIIFSPQLDITTYGSTEKEAQKAFDVHLEEFFNYTTSNNTLDEVLRDLGWTVEKNNVKAPDFSDFVGKNDVLSDIMKKYPVLSVPRDIQVPAPA